MLQSGNGDEFLKDKRSGNKLKHGAEKWNIFIPFIVCFIRITKHLLD